MDKEVSISIDRYTELIQKEQKYHQYKNSLIENTTNNQVVKILTTVESTSLFELYKQLEKEKKGGKQNGK